MDESEFMVDRIKKSLEIHEAAIADLTANEGSAEAVRAVKRRRDHYAQCLNMIEGPMSEKRKSHHCW